MGKRQHQSDKMYITGKEWSAFYGGHRKKIENADFRRLPFFCCSLSMQPFDTPMCTKDGHIFDLLSIIPWLKKYGTNPITGKKMDAKSLVKLNFHKNADGKYHCPVLFKVFNENTHIVAVSKTGNVYSYDAIEQLNIKPKNWRDLLTDEIFARSDLITIQDPTNLDKFNLQSFHHLKHNLRLPEADANFRSKPGYFLNSTNAELEQTMDELNKSYKGDEILKEKPVAKKSKVDKFNAAHYSTGTVSASFTSTAAVPQLETETAVLDDDVVRYGFVKTKGYVRLQTNFGNLNVELHCDQTPKTCENFMKLCQKDYYNGTIFHRSIRNFMIQGGDPTGTGTGGESFWGGTFKDEFRQQLTHTGRGVVSMANSGKDTNKSQFFITFRSCEHLNRKHTVFGRVVGGLDTLQKMENVETEKKTDKPKQEIKLLQAVVFIDPYADADEKLAKLREDEEKRVQAELEEKVAEKKPKPMKVYKNGVGKYIKKPSSEDDKSSTNASAQKKKLLPASGVQFKNFSSW
ncbi:RING-type E3 ubiquitin-protein ligase PPIL2-like [Styela clava]